MSKIYYPVEIPLLLCMFSQTILESVSTNLYIYRTCSVTFGINKSECAQLGDIENENTKSLETLVEPTVNHIDMVLSVLSTAVPTILCMFIGTWSDKFGRKPFLIMSLTGLAIGALISTLFVYFENISPWYFVLSAIPSTFMGGKSTAFIVFTLCIADSSTSENRVFRMGIYEAVIAFAALAGNICSSYIFHATGYLIVFSISTLLLGISVIYVIVLLPESLPIKKKKPNVKEMVWMMNFKEIFKTTLKKRENNKRCYILTIMGLMATYNIVYRGNLAVRTLFLRQKLQWTLTKVTLAASYASVLYIFGALFGTIFLYRKMKFQELHLALLSIVFQGVSSLIRALAVNDLDVYISYALNCFTGLKSSMFRTLLTYLVAVDELGKIYTTSSAVDNLVGTLAGACIYPLFYNATINIDSGLFNYIDLSIFIAIFLVMLILLRNPPPQSRDQLLENKKDTISEKTVEQGAFENENKAKNMKMRV